MPSLSGRSPYDVEDPFLRGSIDWGSQLWADPRLAGVSLEVEKARKETGFRRRWSRRGVEEGHKQAEAAKNSQKQ